MNPIVNNSETIRNIMLFEYKKWNHAVNMIPLICVLFLSCVLENRFNKEYDSYNDCNRQRKTDCNRDQSAYQPDKETE